MQGPGTGTGERRNGGGDPAAWSGAFRGTHGAQPVCVPIHVDAGTAGGAEGAVPPRTGMGRVRGRPAAGGNDALASGNLGERPEDGDGRRRERGDLAGGAEEGMRRRTAQERADDDAGSGTDGQHAASVFVSVLPQVRMGND